MEYERTLFNLIERINQLEKRVAVLEGKKIVKEKPARGTYTNKVINYINGIIAKAKALGKSNIVLTSSAVQREVGLKNRLPLVCNAMRKCMDDKSRILYETPSGQSSTLTIEWNF